MEALPLDNTQFVKVVDEESGKIWIEVGPKLYIPGLFTFTSQLILLT